jgi:hypothetical protein
LAFKEKMFGIFCERPAFTCWIMSKDIYFFISPQIQTQLNWVCNFHIILLWFMLVNKS